MNKTIYLLRVEHKSEDLEMCVNEVFAYSSREVAAKAWNDVVEHLFSEDGSLGGSGDVYTRHNDEHDPAYTTEENIDKLTFHFHENYMFSEWDIIVEETKLDATNYNVLSCVE